MKPPLTTYLLAAADPEGRLSFRDFSEIALYNPEYGYYSRKGKRVGRTQEADFYTAASLGDVYMRLVQASIGNLLEGDSQDYALIELGAEPEGGALQGLAGEFASYRAIGHRDQLEVPAKAVLFANELLDALPFHRFRYTGGRWHELGVRIQAEGLEEVVLDDVSDVAAALIDSLPAASEGYLLDLSLDAERLLEDILNKLDTGLLLFFDYGKSWTELTENTPTGTARAYYQHEANRNLLARPGEQDLTCHVCWDRLEAVLRKAGGREVQTRRQEAFFVAEATPEIERMISTPGQGFDTERQTLKELIYPGHMGQSFQVLSALK
ncbi:MAG: SAM-dependent methyltransferase [Verrucomicrobiota bacterium]